MYIRRAQLALHDETHAEQVSPRRVHMRPGHSQWRPLNPRRASAPQPHGGNAVPLDPDAMDKEPAPMPSLAIQWLAEPRVHNASTGDGA